ncbi:MAG: peptidylprolyl isomerase [Anaerolineales bacterium]
MSEDSKLKNGQVVSMEYTLQVDGKVLDSSEGGDPLQFVSGVGNIIPGLEKEMIGMGVGESKDVVVPPAEGYGEYNQDAFMEVPLDQFPKEVPVLVGTELQVQDSAGNARYARITHVDEKTARLDFNHPLAGKELHFNVKVVDLRDATQEELDHKHVHQDGQHHH